MLTGALACTLNFNMFFIILLVEAEPSQRTTFSYNDWPGSGSRVVNDVHGHRSRPNARSRLSRDLRPSCPEVSSWICV